VFMLPRDKGTNQGKPWSPGTSSGGDGDCWVPTGSPLDPQVEFSVVRAGDFVRVPINAYAVPQRSMAALFGLGMQIGLAAVERLRKHIRGPIKEATLVLANDVSDLGTGFRCYAGVVLKTPATVS